MAYYYSSTPVDMRVWPSLRYLDAYPISTPPPRLSVAADTCLSSDRVLDRASGSLVKPQFLVPTLLCQAPTKPALPCCAGNTPNMRWCGYSPQHNANIGVWTCDPDVLV
jgi:hypothetical protein